MSDTKRCHETLIESEDRFRALADHASDIIAEVDAEGRFLYISPSLTTVLGRAPEAYIGKTLEEGGCLADLHPDDVAPVLAHVRREIGAEEPSRVRIEYRFRHGDGSWHWLESRISSYRSGRGERLSVVVTRDITERVLAQLELRASEERMRQAQKLKGLGIMAAGVAHDFNNLLTPILGNASLALLELSSQSPVRARIERIQRAALRAAGLTRQLLAFTGAGPLVVEPLDVSRIVRETVELLDRPVTEGIRVSFRLERDLPPVEADESQLAQVVANLLTNAFEAIGDGGGRIDVATGTTRVCASSALQAITGSEVVPGVYVYLEVSDDGCGMDAETRDRIFDPFFTTKFTGRGLGLAAVLGLVRSQTGAIEIDSEPNRGTRIRVLLPRAEAKTREWAPQTVAAEAWKGSGTVLVVDDDEEVRDFIAETLKRAGLSVLSAGDGREGAEYFRKHTDAIRAVLLDATMPESSAEETFDEVRRVRPDVPVILVSGYSETRAAARFADRGLADFLQKPFSPADLIATLRRTLEGS